jgi:hypothetical protein
MIISVPRRLDRRETSRLGFNTKLVHITELVLPIHEYI